MGQTVILTDPTGFRRLKYWFNPIEDRWVFVPNPPAYPMTGAELESRQADVAVQLQAAWRDLEAARATFRKQAK